ncbi:MAG: dTDP-4-dehydrorhamnose 3,5-epimerase family protein [Cyclobacteriaceae bacterium]
MKQSKLISGKKIQDCQFVLLDEKSDHRGSFTEVFQKHWNTCLDPVQWSFVRSEAEVFRGMHLHLRHDEYFCLTQGHCYLGLKDLREDSTTYGAYSLYELFEDSLAALVFPRGLLHGWYFTKPSLHIQAVSESYIDYGKDDNWGCRWDAPDLGIPWPFKSSRLSKRAQGFPDVKTLHEVIGTVG